MAAGAGRARLVEEPQAVRRIVVVRRYTSVEILLSIEFILSGSGRSITGFARIGLA